MMKQVSKAEFLKFLDAYPRKLDHDMMLIVEPPLECWHDFTLSEFASAESIVASIVRHDLAPPLERRTPENIYSVRVD